MARAAGRARSQRFRATSADRNESATGEAPKGRARAERAKLRVTPGTSGAKEFEDGRKRQKLPSPALKEAERSGSYNPGDLNTLTGGTVRSGTVQGQ